jgi:hypothetical protein
MSNPINISDPEITFTAEEFDIPAFVKDCTRASNPEYRGNNVYGEAHRHLSTMRWFLSSNHRVDNNQIHFSLDKGRPALTVRDFRAIVSVLSQYAHTPKRFETNVSSGEDNEKMVYGWKNPSHPFINDETWEAKSRQSLNLHFAHRLLREVTAWVDSHFNFIPLGVAEKMATTENGNTLHEYIRQPEITEEDLAKYDLLESYREAEADDPGEYMQEYAPDAYHEKMDSNYPMHGTLFEFRDGTWGSFIEAAQDAGFIVLEDVPGFDGVMLGVAGCGYSFYGQHWIPLYLALYTPHNEKLHALYAGVDYSMV